MTSTPDSPVVGEASILYTPTRTHRVRRHGWRGWIDFVLHRKPLTVIDDVDMDSLELVPRDPRS